MIVELWHFVSQLSFNDLTVEGCSSSATKTVKNGTAGSREGPDATLPAVLVLRYIMSRIKRMTQARWNLSLKLDDTSVSAGPTLFVPRNSTKILKETSPVSPHP